LTVLTSVISGFAVAGDSSEDFLGLGIWGLGVIWLVLGWREQLPPQRTSYALGSLATLVGVVALGFDSPGIAAILGVATAGGLFAMSVAVRSTILLGFGAAGTFVFVPQLIIEFFGDSIGIPLALFIAGVLLVGISLLAIRLRRSVKPESGAQKSDPSVF
jgi:hypothetical protein